MSKILDGWREWFDALSDTARLIWPKPDEIITTAAMSAHVARLRNEIAKHEGGITHHNCCPPGECKRRPRCEGNDIVRPQLWRPSYAGVRLRSPTMAETVEFFPARIIGEPKDRRAQDHVEGRSSC